MVYSVLLYSLCYINWIMSTITSEMYCTFFGFNKEWLNEQKNVFFDSIVQVKIVNSSDEIVPIGESGEVCTRGYSTMLNYWNDPEKTREVIGPGNWYHTGWVHNGNYKDYLYKVNTEKQIINYNSCQLSKGVQVSMQSNYDFDLVATLIFDDQT